MGYAVYMETLRPVHIPSSATKTRGCAPARGTPALANGGPCKMGVATALHAVCPEEAAPAKPEGAAARIFGTESGRGSSGGSERGRGDAPGSSSPEPAHFIVNDAVRYASWYETREGAFALARKKELLRRLLSGWVRRSRSMLVMSAGQGLFLESLWESGFDVTGQEHTPDLLAEARGRLGNRADFALGAPDYLPFDDCSFDYAVAVDALEFWPDPEAALREMSRVACGGIILIFPNAWSLFGLRCRLWRGHGNYASMAPYMQSPCQVQRLIRSAFGQEKTEWRSALLAPTSTWRPHPVLEFINAMDIRLAVGGFTGVRIDFGSVSTGTPLALRAGGSVSTAE